MDDSCARDECGHCPGRVICRCLQVTEDALLHVLCAEEVRTLNELRQRTGAGDGCTACHRRLRQLLERRFELVMAQPSASSASPI